MVPIISPARGAHNSTIEHVYNRDIIYLSSTTPYQDKGEIAYTYASSPDMKNPELPHNLQVRLEIRFKDKAYSTNGTFVGPHHILTSCKHIYNSQEKTWADEIHVSCIKNYPVVNVYIFTEWARTQNRHYNIALLILGKSIGKYTGWSGMLSVPDIFLQREIVHVLGVQHTIQKITPEEVHCDPKFNSEQAGSSLLVHYWKSPMVIGLVTLDKDHTLTLRLSKEKCAAVAEIIGENFKKYPRIAFGKARWAQYFGDVGEEPPLPHNIKEILNAPCPIWPNKKVHETHLLTLIPKTVDGEYLTLKALGELVQKPLEGLPSAFAWRDLGEYQDTPPKHSYWILSSRDVIPDSRNKTFANQKKLLDKYPGYEILRIMDIAVALFMEHVRYGSRLYSDEPWTFTRCQEQYNVDCPLVVGDFGLRGLNMSHNYNGDDKNCGIGIFRSL